MDTPLKQEILQLVNECKDIHQLTHIKLLLESERTSTSIVAETSTPYGISTIEQAQKEIAALLKEIADVDFLQQIKDEIDPNAVDDFQGLSPEDREELLELINEPVGKDTISHDEFLKTMARWDIK